MGASFRVRYADPVGNLLVSLPITYPAQGRSVLRMRLSSRQISYNMEATLPSSWRGRLLHFLSTVHGPRAEEA